MKTFLGKELPIETRGVLYLCHYDYVLPKLTVVAEVGFLSAFEALEAYANIPNPESQMASGRTQEEFEMELSKLHANMNDPEWVKELADYL